MHLRIPIALILLGMALPVQALRFYVNPSTGDDRRSVQSAQNPATPFKTIAHALRIAHLIPEGRPHVILIPGGTYAPRTGEKFPLTISQTGIYLEPQGTDLIVFDAEGKSNIVQITAPTSDFVLKGIDFLNGRAARGGAVYCQTCSLRVVESRFFANQATQGGQLAYVEKGRLKFYKNVVRDNGRSGDQLPVIELRNSFTDTTVRDEIRNNTFYRNPPPNILSASPRTYISSNIFLDPEQPAILDAAAAATPLIGHNLFWQAEVLYVSDKGDSIKIQRTERDTLSFQKAGISVPSFMLNTPAVKTLRFRGDTLSLARLNVRLPSFVKNAPDTLAKVGIEYLYRISLDGDSTKYALEPLILPTGVPSDTVKTNRRVKWTPTLNDTLSHPIRIKITSPAGAVDTLSYNLDVFTAQAFPDTTGLLAVRDAAGRFVGMVKETTTIEVPHTVGQNYQFRIQVSGNRDLYVFNPLVLPSGASSTRLTQESLIDWTPALADTGSKQVRVEIIDPVGVNGILNYNIHVFTAAAFPDTSELGPVVTSRLIPDTTAALNALNSLKPTFSSASSAGDNLFANPTFLDSTVNRFELVVGSPAIDKGTPVISLRDAGGGSRNDIGALGGPNNPGAPQADTTFTELKITTLPDSVVTEGQVFTYNPTLDPAAKVELVDLNQPAGQAAPTTMGPFNPFGKEPPITWTPTLADTGTYLIGVKVFTGSRFGRHYFSLRVKPANEIPLVSSAPDTLAFEDQAYAYAIQASDPNNDALTYSLASGPQGMGVQASTGLVSWTPAQSDVGTHLVEVRIDDGRGGIHLHRFNLIVRNTNDLPVIASIPDTTALEDAPYTYAVVATDADLADTLSYSLTIAPAGATIDSLGILRWTPVQAQVGLRSFAVRVQDRNGGSVQQSFAVRVVQVDDLPAISSAPDTTALEDELYRYAVAASDEEGGKLRFVLESGPQGMAIDTSGVLSWTPTASDIGSHPVVLRVTDPAGQAAVQSFVLVVQPVNDAPRVLAAIPAEALVRAAPGASLRLAVSADDEEGDPLTLSWLVNAAVQAGATDTSFTYAPSTSRIDTVTVRLADGADTTSFTWRVDGRLIPRIAVATDTVRFGSVGIGDTARVVLSVANQGDLELTISSLQVDNLRFAASFAASTLAPGAATQLELRYMPIARRAWITSISFATDDPDRPLVTIPIKAQGIVPTRLSFDLDAAAGNQNRMEMDVQAGQQIEVALYAQKALSLLNYQARLAFVPSQLRFVGFAAREAGEANLLDAEGATLLAVATTPADTLVQATLTSQGLAQGVSGSGLLGIFSFAVDSSFAIGSQAHIRLVRILLQSQGQAAPDTLQPAVDALLRGQPLLLGDFNGDGAVDFDDFFLFADHFNTTPSSPAWDPLFSLDGDQDVDFDDFFVFADQFGKGAAKLSLGEPPLEASLGLRLGIDSPQQTEFQLHWQGPQDLRGYALELAFDPQVLSFNQFRPRAAEAPLVWIAQSVPGRLVLAVGLALDQVPFADSDLGTLVFARQEQRATWLEPVAAMAYEGGRSAGVGLPPLVRLAALPETYVLYAAHPNPFNPQTLLPFYVPRDSQVRLRVYDLLGRPVRTLIDGRLSAGYHQRLWRGTDDQGRPVGAGPYLIELRAGDWRQVRKVMLLK